MTVSITPKMLSTWVTQAPSGLGKAGLLQNWGGRMQLLNEGDHGLSHTVFAQHLLMTWVPKMAASRSWAERGEITFLEVLETFLVYYSIPLTARGFHKMLQHFLPKAERHLLLEPVGSILKKHPQAAGRVLPVKAAIVLAAMVAGGAGWEYALTFAKNLLTAKAFKMDSFKHITNLEQQGQHNISKEDSPVVLKARKRIRQSLKVLGATFVASLLLASAGQRSALAKKISALFLEGFDFKVAKHIAANGKKSFSYGLTDWQNRFFITTAFVAYMDAIRDKLEALEVFTRLSLTMTYLAVGNSWINNMTIKLLGNNPTFQHLFKQESIRGTWQRIQEDVLNAAPKPPQSVTVIKNLETLAEEAMATARQKAPHLGQEALEAVGRKHFWKVLPNKVLLFIIPQAIGLGIAGFGNAFLNRYWTAHRFKENKAGVQHESGEMFSVWGFLKEKLTGKTASVTASPTPARTLQPVSAQTMPRSMPTPMPSAVMQPALSALSYPPRPAMSWGQPAQQPVWPGVKMTMPAVPTMPTIPPMPVMPGGVSSFRLSAPGVIPGNWLPAVTSAPAA